MNKLHMSVHTSGVEFTVSALMHQYPTLLSSSQVLTIYASSTHLLIRLTDYDINNYNIKYITYYKRST